MIIKLSSIFLFGVAIFFFSCKKEMVPDNNVKIETVSVVVRNDSLYLKGNAAISTGSSLDSMGFVLGSKSKPDKNSLVLFTDKHDENGNYMIILADRFIKDSVYYVRSMIQSEGYIFYGNEMTFTSQNLNLPGINDFTPSFGKDNEYVKIYGSNFGSNLNDVSVLFGNKSAEVVSCIPERLLVKVPAYTYSENCLITVKIKNNQTSSTKPFFLYGPLINDFSPVEGSGLVTIIINGNNFSDFKWRNSVFIGSRSVEILESSVNRIVVKTDLTEFLPGPYTITVVTLDKSVVAGPVMNIVSRWKKLADLPIGGIAGAVTFRISDKIYLCTGTSNWLNSSFFSSIFLVYDISKDSWTRKADFPGAVRNKAVGFAVGEKGYLGLGETSSLGPLLDFWEYDPMTDKWTRKSDFPGRGRAGAVGFSYKNNGFILMGKMLDNIPPYLTDFWSYSPETDSWQKLPDFISSSLSSSQIAILSDKLYLIGGIKDQQGTVDLETFRYDLTLKKWNLIGPLSDYPLYAFYDDNKCYLINSKNELVEFLPETGKMIKMPIFPGISISIWADRPSGLIFNNKIYFGTGSFGGYGECIDDFWSFDLF